MALSIVPLMVLLASCHNVDGIGKPDDTGSAVDTGGTPEDTAPPPPVDEDGDGYTSDEDCDDSDPDVHPGADEVDNGLDDDCDGYVDEWDVCDGVDADFGTIQEAIDAASDGRVILVCPGTYAENPEVRRKSLSILSTDGPEVTTIAGGPGGPVFTWAGSSGSLFQGFTLSGGGGSSLGGGMLVRDADIEIADCIFDGTSSTGSGGGLAVIGGNVELHGNRYVGCSAEDYGGGAYIEDATGSIDGDSFEGCSANYGGGLLVYEGALTVQNSTFDSGYARSYAGGFYVYNSDAPILDNTFTNNAVDEEEEDSGDGGALYVVYGSGEIAGNTFEGNTCNNDGGAVYIYVGSQHIHDNTFTNNVSYDDAGGLRVYVSTTVVESNTFQGNSAADDGGALKLSHSTDTITGNTFIENSAGDAGGGLELDNEAATVTGNTFTGNTAYRGAGMHSWRTEGTVTIEDDTFDSNQAEDCGGGISIDNDPHQVSLSHLVFTGNTASDGAALCVDLVYRDIDGDDKIDDYYDVSILSFTNSLLYENEASDDGGAVYLKAARATFRNLVLHGNQAGTGIGSAVAVKEDTTLVLSNTILSENQGAAAIGIEDEPSLRVSYSDFYANDGDADGMDDPVGSDGNLGSNPMFTDAAGGDFHLEPSSPCVDAGDPSLTDPDGSRSDMGAYGGPDGSW